MSLLPPDTGDGAFAPLTPQELRAQAFLHRQRRRRFFRGLGFVILLSGYAVLAVSPETPTEWVLLRVVFGFALLLAGFGLSILPMLTHFTQGDDSDR